MAGPPTSRPFARFCVLSRTPSAPLERAMLSYFEANASTQVSIRLCVFSDETEERGPAILPLKRPPYLEARETQCVAKILGVSLCPYQFRHGGPSHDVARKKRTLGQVRVRGCWMVEASVRRYQKSGRLIKAINGLPTGVREFGENILQEFELHYAGKQVPVRLLPNGLKFGRKAARSTG